MNTIALNSFIVWLFMLHPKKNEESTFLLTLQNNLLIPPFKPYPEDDDDGKTPTQPLLKKGRPFFHILFSINFFHAVNISL